MFVGGSSVGIRAAHLSWEEAAALPCAALTAYRALFVMPTSLSLLLAAYPKHRRSLAVGTWASIGAVAAALGPPLGGLLVLASWHWVFLVNVPVGLVALVAGLRLLRESEPTAAGRPDVLGACALIIGVGALAFALVRAPEIGWTARAVVAGLVITVIGVAAVVVRSRRHPVPAVDLGVLRIPVVALAAAHHGRLHHRFRRDARGERALPDRDVGLVGEVGLRGRVEGVDAGVRRPRRAR